MNPMLLCLMCVALNADPAPVKITIHIDRRNPVERTLQSELSVDWKKRVNPVVAKNGFDQKQLDFFERTNQRVADIKKVFKITFEDRTRSHADFGFTVGEYRTSLYKLPDKEIMCESTTWIELFEFLIDDLKYHEDKFVPWQEQCHLIDITADSELGNYKFEFARKYAAAREGWYVGEASEGVYDKDGNYHMLSDLEGYDPQIAKAPYPPMPLKPKSPIVGFDFSWSPNK